MNNNEKQFENFVRQIKFDDTPDPNHRDKLEHNLLPTIAKQQAPRQIKIWRTIMKSQITKLATAAVIIIAVTLGLTTILDKSVTPAWAIEDTIEALERFNAVHITGVSAGENGSGIGYNLWAKSNEDHTQSSDFRMEMDDGQIRWVEENDTYHYEPNKNTVRVIRGQRASLSPWIGRDFFQTLEKVTEDWQVLYGKDPASGRDRVFVTCRHKHAPGPKSWWFEFDLETKLPVRFKQWHNFYWQGKPTLDAQRIIYYKNLPNEVFEFEVPEGAEIKEVSVPSQMLDILNDPNYGILVEGLNQYEACRKILEQFWQAVINGDLTHIRQLLPIAADWNDEVLKSNIGLNGDDRPVEFLEIGQPCNESTSEIGPTVVVPSLFKCKDGKTREAKLIIQFRQINGQSSCVIYANYGDTREIE